MIVAIVAGLWALEKLSVREGWENESKKDSIGALAELLMVSL